MSPQDWVATVVRWWTASDAAPPPRAPTPPQGWMSLPLKNNGEEVELWVETKTFMEFANLDEYRLREIEYKFLLDIEKVYLDGVEYRRAPLTGTNANPVAGHSPGFFEYQPYYAKNGHSRSFGNGNYDLGEAFAKEIARADLEVQQRAWAEAAKAREAAHEAMLENLWRDE